MIIKIIKFEQHDNDQNDTSGLPPGFILTEEILNAEKPNLPPPATIHYTEKHVIIMNKNSK